MWETNPLPGQTPSINATAPHLHNLLPLETDAAGAGGGAGGIYKDRLRWLAVLYVPMSGSIGRHHLLGRFDTEEEANTAYRWVSSLISSEVNPVLFFRYTEILIYVDIYLITVLQPCLLHILAWFLSSPVT